VKLGQGDARWLGATSVSSSAMVADTDSVNLLENLGPLDVLWLSAYENRALTRTVDDIDDTPSGLRSSARQQNQMARVGAKVDNRFVA
jgi:hypothetical protein